MIAIFLLIANMTFSQVDLLYDGTFESKHQKVISRIKKPSDCYMMIIKTFTNTNIETALRNANDQLYYGIPDVTCINFIHLIQKDQIQMLIIQRCLYKCNVVTINTIDNPNRVKEIIIMRLNEKIDIEKILRELEDKLPAFRDNQVALQSVEGYNDDPYYACGNKITDKENHKETDFTKFLF